MQRGADDEGEKLAWTLHVVQVRQIHADGADDEKRTRLDRYDLHQAS